MDSIDFPRFIFASLFILGLIGVFGALLRRFGKSNPWLGTKEGEGRLSILEMRALDPKRRLVLVRRDNTEHLLLLADGRELVIESNITKE